MMAPVGFGIRFSRLQTLRASSRGQALLTWACARSSGLTSIFGLTFSVGLAAMRGGASLACGMLAFRAASVAFNLADKFHSFLNCASISLPDGRACPVERNFLRSRRLWLPGNERGTPP